MRRCSKFAIAAAAALALSAPPASALPGGVFITGHDADFHARVGGTVADARQRAQNIINRAVEFVSGNHPNPSILYVTSRITPPSGHIDGSHGISDAGLIFHTAAAGGTGAVLDLAAVNFEDYDVIVIASDFGGILTQGELNILNARGSALRAFVNNGGGIVALSESNGGAQLTPGGGHFDWLPFLGSEAATHQTESDYTVTAFGASLGLTDADVNGNFSHNTFTSLGGLQVVDRDGASRPVSLAAFGSQLCPGGLPAVSVDDVAVAEPDGGDVALATFTVSLSVAPCAGPATVEVATSDGTASSTSDYTALAPTTLTFAEGETSKTVSVAVAGDNLFEDDETFFVGLSRPTDMAIADGQGRGTITNDDPENRDPDCSTVAATPGALWPPNHKFRTITLNGGTDPDTGDTVRLAITGVTQDEPLNGTGDGDTSPDAANMAGASVDLRAERAGGADGRVYRISFVGTDSHGAACTGTAVVGVPHDQRGGAAVDSGDTYNSLG